MPSTSQGLQAFLLSILLLLGPYCVVAQNSQSPQIPSLTVYLDSLLPQDVEGEVFNNGGNIEARIRSTDGVRARKIARDFMNAAFNSGRSIRSAKIEIIQPTGEIGLSITLGANIAAAYKDTNWIDPTTDPSRFIRWLKQVSAQHAKGSGVALASSKNAISVKGPWSELLQQESVTNSSTLAQTQRVNRSEPPVIVAQTKTATPEIGYELSEEIALGLAQRNEILSLAREIKNTAEDQLAQTVLLRLRTTQVFRSAPLLPYSVTIIEDNAPRASVGAGGDVYVTSGMAQLLGSDEGLWAAVMGHELGHAVKRHVYKSIFRKAQLRQQIEMLRIRAAAGDESANWSLIAVAIAGRLLNNKMERDDESEADKLGLEMMVEAGYHPDFAITLYRRLRTRFGDESKFAALFSDHPRWVTREERVLKLFDEALARFESLWPDPTLSPGGPPPIMATLGKISSKENKSDKSVMMQIPYTVRNAKNVEIIAVMSFTFKGYSVSSQLPEFQARDGSLIAVKTFMPVSRSQAGSVGMTIPTAAVGIKERKLKAKLCLQEQSEILECSKEKEISFPKN